MAEISNLALYEKVRAVPVDAQKPIKGGRQSGKTDINPMWRIKTLTEQFGPCGIGWRYEIIRLWLEPGADGVISAFTQINLYTKIDGQWSEAIPGIGGNAFVDKETKGLYTSDECYKMALTDAISVSCKALGIGADVYWQADKSKYGGDEPGEPVNYACEDCGTLFAGFTDPEGKERSAEWVYKAAKMQRGAHICKHCFEDRQLNQAAK